MLLSALTYALSPIHNTGTANANYDNLDSMSLFSGYSQNSRTSKKTYKGGSRKSFGGNSINSNNSNSDSISKRTKGEISMARSQSTSELLKTELLQSLRSMQNATIGVKSGIASVQSMVNIDNPRAKMMVFNVAAGKISLDNYNYNYELGSYRVMKS